MKELAMYEPVKALNELQTGSMLIVAAGISSACAGVASRGERTEWPGPCPSALVRPFLFLSLAPLHHAQLQPRCYSL